MEDIYMNDDYALTDDELEAREELRAAWHLPANVDVVEYIGENS